MHVYLDVDRSENKKVVKNTRVFTTTTPTSYKDGYAVNGEQDQQYSVKVVLCVRLRSSRA